MTDNSTAPEPGSHLGHRVARKVKVRVIAGRSLDDWREFAKRDDCLDRMVPSDLRQILGAIPDH